jgi:outer membrane lipoprotein-sorting protein
MKEKTLAIWMCLLIVGVVFAGADCGSQEKTAQPPKAINELEQLLDNIEQSGSKLQSFQADMLYAQLDPLRDTLVKRGGELYYRTGTDKTAVMFRIHFDDYLQQDLTDPASARPVKYDEDYVFDGMWVTRRNTHTKTIQKWEVSRTANDKEMFRLGKGPFPLPFAIKKKDIKENFDVKLPGPDPNEPADPANTHHLQLLPRAQSSYAKDYLQMNLWIDQKTSIPVQISYQNIDYEVTTVTWTKIKTDKQIKDKVFELETPGNDWDVDIKPLQEPDAQTTSK